MNFTEGIVLGIMLIIIIFYVQAQSSEVEYVVSDIDGRRYLVKTARDKKEAANLLAQVNKLLLSLIKEMKKIHPNDDDVIRLDKNYNAEHLSEGTDQTNYTSYSVNKGEQIVFCLRSRDTQQKLVPLNVLMYVAIHELAHLMTKEIGHPPEFWKNFKRLLNTAIDMNIYKKVDYANNPVNYCGLTIKSSVV